MSCAICGKRPPKRFCPAKGEKICAICCGEGREVTIDCPLDCSYLGAAHRYEAEHRKQAPAGEIPFRDVQFPVEFIYEHWPVVSALGSSILGFYAQNKDLNDRGIFTAVEALAETYRTLAGGILYERAPDLSPARELYGSLAQFLAEFRKRETERAGFPTLKDTDIFYLLVFLLRMGKQETNGRPLSRAFLDFLRGHFAASAPAVQETSRIIVP
ncbi:MAG TPA: hypothetical protein VMJ93_02600 [Verrucomicrobiae bacterium]|nr:hypothetical protein [Verrucomicrobiae bacterium]